MEMYQQLVVKLALRYAFFDRAVLIKSQYSRLVGAERWQSSVKRAGHHSVSPVWFSRLRQVASDLESIPVVLAAFDPSQYLVIVG